MRLPLLQLLSQAIQMHWIVDTESGQVYSRRYNRPLKGKIDKDGYLVYGLPGSNSTVPAHFVIWWATEGSLPPETINHRDGNKLNNRRDNLEASTGAQNTAHAGRLGLMAGSGPGKLTEQTARELRKLARSNGNVVQLAKRFGVSRKTVREVRDGKTWQTIEVSA